MKISRGGVEDTRLEVKAKETKKIRGQGQPFRGQTLLRSRTGMLEAKDQGDKRKCSPKKKIFKIFFQAISKKKSLQKFFQAFSNKKRLLKSFFRAIYKISTIQKRCCPRAEDRAIFEDLRSRGQRLDLRGQRLQNVSSRTSSRYQKIPN